MPLMGSQPRPTKHGASFLVVGGEDEVICPSLWRGYPSIFSEFTSYPLEFGT